MKDNLLQLTTEERNPHSMNLPHLSIAEATAMMNQEDEECTRAVKKILPAVNQVIAHCVDTIKNGGRVIFIGAAHSGYLGMLDAYEANATFGTTDEFTAIVAGNFTDMMKTDGSAEDIAENGPADLKSRHVNQNDYVIGLSSSGRTPYVIGALTWCQENNIACAGLVNNYDTIAAKHCDLVMEAVAGAEVITGSTRLKAGTAQKMILNMITTITMAQLGNVYENLMINVPPVSKKMRTRLEYILSTAASCPLEKAHELLMLTDYKVKPALIMALKNVNKEQAEIELENVHGNINLII